MASTGAADVRQCVLLIVAGAAAAAVCAALLVRGQPEPSAEDVLGWTREVRAGARGSLVPFHETYTDTVRRAEASGYLRIGPGGTFRQVYETPMHDVICGDGHRVVHEQPGSARYFFTEDWLPGFELITGGPAACRYQVDPRRPDDGENVCLRCSPGDRVGGQLRVCVSSAGPTRGAVTTLHYLRRGGAETVYRFGLPRRPDAQDAEEPICADPTGRPNRAGWTDVTRR